MLLGSAGTTVHGQAVIPLPSTPAAAPVVVRHFAGLPAVRQAPAASVVELEQVPAHRREQVRQVLQQPTLATRGPCEEFTGKPAVYHWLLDHPDRAAAAWRQLGAPCLDITDQGDGRFGWADSHGSNVAWETIQRSPQLRVWYAEGTVRPGVLFPPVPVQAVLVLHHEERPDGWGQTQIQHQADVFVQTDSKTAALLLRLLGPSAPHLAEQCLRQLEMFFSALTHYLHRNPHKCQELLR
jgi:hypothetical protein